MTQRTFLFQEGALLTLKMNNVTGFKGSRQSIPEDVFLLWYKRKSVLAPGSQLKKKNGWG